MKDRLFNDETTYDSLTGKHISTDAFFQQSIKENEIYEGLKMDPSPLYYCFGDKEGIRENIEIISRFEKEELKAETIDIEFKLYPDKHLRGIFLSVPGEKQPGDDIYYIVCYQDTKWRCYTCSLTKEGYALYKVEKLVKNITIKTLFGMQWPEYKQQKRLVSGFDKRPSVSELWESIANDYDESNNAGHVFAGCNKDTGGVFYFVGDVSVPMVTMESIGHPYDTSEICCDGVDYLILSSADRKKMIILRSNNGKPDHLQEEDMSRIRDVIQLFE